MAQIETFEGLPIVDTGGRSLISALDAKKISFPDNGADFGNSGDQLRSLGNGGVEWAAPGMPTYEQTEQALSNWLDEHPEAVTTVEDGAITDAKLNDALKRGLVYGFETVADMKAATTLNDGMICHTSGFLASGDGGAAWYEISENGTPDEKSIIACQDNLKAHLVKQNVIKYIDKFEDIANRVFIEGETVHILGYHAPGDGGGSICTVTSTPSTERLQYQTSDGLYLEVLDSDLVLPRFGGVYVNEMVDNLKNSNIANVEFNYRKIILPPPNSKHPGCVQWKTNAFAWTIDDTILIDDSLNCSEFYIYGEIRAVGTIGSMLKCAGASKPENIYFKTPLVLTGVNPSANDGYFAVDCGIEVADSARFVVEDCIINYCKTGIVVGGENSSQTGGAELLANNIDIGYFDEIGMKLDGVTLSGGGTSAVRLNVEQMQIAAPYSNVAYNPDPSATNKQIIGLYGTGVVACCNVGNLQVHYNTSPKYISYPIYLDHQSASRFAYHFGVVVCTGLIDALYAYNAGVTIDHMVAGYNANGTRNFYANGSQALSIGYLVNYGNVNFKGGQYTTIYLGHLTGTLNDVDSNNFVYNGISKNCGLPNAINISDSGVLTVRRNSVNHVINS